MPNLINTYWTVQDRSGKRCASFGTQTEAQSFANSESGIVEVYCTKMYDDDSRSVVYGWSQLHGQAIERAL